MKHNANIYPVFKNTYANYNQETCRENESCKDAAAKKIIRGKNFLIYSGENKPLKL